VAKNDEARHIVVSGGSRGLGLAMVRDLLVQGYLVSTFSRGGSPELDALAREHGERAHVASVDIADAEALVSFVRAGGEKLGRVWGLVNNSAIAVEGVLATLPEVEIERMLAVNLDGPLRLARLCIRDMLVANRGGRILNVGSIVGSRGFTGLSVYSATKAALDGMTRSLARELGRKQITVNSIAPGYMRTDMSAGLGQTQVDQILRRVPLGRLATEADVVPLVRFLLSDDAAYISGETIRVDGASTA
jgi:3-oxoacyl-[acyl-carrier protein] reductase